MTDGGKYKREVKGQREKKTVDGKQEVLRLADRLLDHRLLLAYFVFRLFFAEFFFHRSRTDLPRPLGFPKPSPFLL